MYPSLPLLETHPINPSPQLPSASQGVLASRIPQTLWSLQIHTMTMRLPPILRRYRRYKSFSFLFMEQKLQLQKYFNKCKSPRQEECVELAQRIGMAEHQIQIRFKNQWATYKQKNLQNVPEGDLETAGSSKAVSGSSSSHGHLSVLASVNGESMSPGTFGVGSIPKLTFCLEPSLHADQALEGTRYSPKENLHHFEYLGQLLTLANPSTRSPN